MSRIHTDYIDFSSDGILSFGSIVVNVYIKFLVKSFQFNKDIKLIVFSK